MTYSIVARDPETGALFRAEYALGAGDNAALREIESAYALLPDDENIRLLRGGALIFDGRIDEGRAVMRELFDRRPTWSTVLASFVDKGLIAIPAGVDPGEFLGR